MDRCSSTLSHKSRRLRFSLDGFLGKTFLGSSEWQSHVKEMNDARRDLHEAVELRMEENAAKMKERVEMVNTTILHTFKVGEWVRVLREPPG